MHINYLRDYLRWEVKKRERGRRKGLKTEDLKKGEGRKGREEG